MMELSVTCPHCGKAVSVKLASLSSAPCPSCGKELFHHATDAFKRGESLDQCPICGTAHLYRQKDFNRALGILALVVGIALAYFTYGISLLVVTVMDWVLYRRVGEVGCCYLCHAQFRESALVAKLDPFSLSLFDYYRNVRDSKKR